MATRYQLAEQARRLYKGQVNDDVKVTMKEVMLLVDQAASKFFVQGRINELAEGERIPDSLSTLEYTATVTTGGTDSRFSTAPLPIYPIRLPRQMGVWSIFPIKGGVDMPYDEFIPLNTFMGMSDGLQEGFLEGLVGYEVKGNTVRFNKDLTQDSITSVKMQIITKDPSKLSDTDPYPIPADHEHLVIEDVIRLLSVRPQVIDQTNDNREQA